MEINPNSFGKRLRAALQSSKRTTVTPIRTTEVTPSTLADTHTDASQPRDLRRRRPALACVKLLPSNGIVAQLQKAPKPSLEFSRRYNLGKVLGQGTYGTVYEGWDKELGIPVAVKRIPRAKLESKEMQKQVKDEVLVMKQLDHPFLNRLYDSYFTDDDVFLVLEFASSGNALQFVNKFKHEVDVRAIFTIFWQVVSGVEYCHENLVCHRDIKPENILLDSAGHAKLADFGFARFMESDCAVDSTCGSPHYTAPEVHREKHAVYDGKKADMFSLGCLLYALTTRRLPFKSETVSYNNLIKAGDLYFPSALGEDFRTFVLSLTNWSPEKRPTMAALKAHPFWVKRCELYELPVIGCNFFFPSRQPFQDASNSTSSLSSMCTPSEPASLPGAASNSSDGESPCPLWKGPNTAPKL